MSKLPPATWMLIWPLPRALRMSPVFLSTSTWISASGLALRRRLTLRSLFFPLFFCRLTCLARIRESYRPMGVVSLLMNVSSECDCLAELPSGMWMVEFARGVRLRPRRILSKGPDRRHTMSVPGSFLLHKIDIIALNVYNYARCGSIGYSKTANGVIGGWGSAEWRLNEQRVRL